MNDDPGNSKSLVTAHQEMATAQALYGDQREITEFAIACQLVAPWARGMEKNEVGLVVRRALAMGVDPLNPHEVQIWQGKGGNIQFQLAYTLVTEWVRHFHGQHTQPQYTELSDVEKADEGMLPGHMAYRVTFIMHEDMAHLRTLIDAGFDGPEARAMVTTVGLGTASPKELSGTHFAPVGRSKAWKVQKRALTDAYRRRYGTPTRDENMELRRASGRDRIQPGDWVEVAAEADGGLSGVGATELAQMRADARKRKAKLANMTPDQREEMVSANVRLLRGDADAIDGVLVSEGASDETLDRTADDGGPAASVSDQVSILLASVEGMGDGEYLPAEGNVAAQAITDEVGDLGGYKPPLKVGQARVLCQVALAAVGEAEGEAHD